MRVGWLADTGSYVGGAELTQAEFKAAAPEGVEIVDCPPGEIDPTCDRYVVHNCVLYPAEELRQIKAPTIKYWNDVGPHLQPGVREWLDENAAIYACCSPLQVEYMGFERTRARCIPPAIDLSRFEQAATSINGNRSGSVCVASWRNYGKGPHKVLEWARKTGVEVDFFGDGPFAPKGSMPVPNDAMPALLAQYETLVFLPTVIEPFGRVVAEAWAAGCEVVTNGLVGARFWIESEPERLETAAEDFWRLVLDDAIATR